MITSNPQLKKRKEGCGKWLTKQGKVIESSKKQLHFKFTPRTSLKPVIFEGKSKSGKTKQSTMNQFLMERTSKRKKDEVNLNAEVIPGHRDEEKVLCAPHNRSITLSVIKDEDLWGSESEEDETYQTEDWIQNMSCEKRQNILQCMYVPDTTSPSPKRLKSSTGIMEHGNEVCNLTRNEVDLSEWFENEVDALITHNTKDVLNRETIFSIISKHPGSHECPNSEEESSQFTEWFKQQFENLNRNDLADKTLQWSTRDEPQQNNKFTQWFEAIFEKRASAQ